MTKTFATRLIRWQKSYGRHGLPWQGTTDPYRVWLSEIMLQQTQVATVIPYYERFLARFPTLADLGAAPIEAVMSLWSGLGYYARARNLHRCAQTVVASGRWPRDPDALSQLPGIGYSTANAIAVFCFGARAPILDGNVKRLLCRHAGVEASWPLAEARLPQRNVATYIQAQMDMGATVCTRSRPHCEVCPVAQDCVARQENRIEALPLARPRKVRPEKTVTVLILVCDDAVLLEQRPPKGIWGGLLSLPELPAGKTCEGLALPPVVHDFTHFRLTIHPVRCDSVPDEHRYRRIAKKELAHAALPAPIRKILNAAL